MEGRGADSGVHRSEGIAACSTVSCPRGGNPKPNDLADLKPLFEEALARSEKKYGAQSAETARSGSDLGLFLKTLNDSSSAVAPLTRAMEIDQTNGSAMVQADQESLAATLLAAGKRQEAYDLFRAAAQGGDSAIAARCLAQLAALDSGNAEAYYRLALQREEKAAGKDDPLIAVVLNNLGLALRQKNDYRSAGASVPPRAGNSREQISARTTLRRQQR